MSDQDARLLKKQIGTINGTPLMANLDWRPISKGSVSHVIRQAKSTGIKPSHIVQVKSDEAMVVGLYTAPPSEDGIKLPKGAASAAACFAKQMAMQSDSAALVMSLGDEKFYVCTITDGVPTIDKIVSSREEAAGLIQFVPLVLSNDDVSFPGSAVDWDWLLAAERDARLVPTPVDPRSIVYGILALMVVCAVAAGILLIQQKKRRDKEAAQEAARVAADPVPKYNAALAQARTKQLIRHMAWAKLRDDLLDIQLTAPGWIRRGLNCDGATATCESEWERKGGTTPELKAALLANGKREQLIESGQVETYKSTFKFEPSFVNAIDRKFATELDWRETNAELTQNWATAGFAPRLNGPARLWPTADGVQPDFRAENTMGTFPIQITIPAIFLDEVLEVSPKELSWSVMQFQFNAGTDAKQRVIINLQGAIYVALK